MIEQKEMKKSQKIVKWFNTMTFKNKLLLVFLLSSIIILTVTNITIGILIIKFGEQDLSFITAQNKKFNQLSTSQITQALTKTGVTGRDVSTMLIFELSYAYKFFSSNPKSYITQEKINPYLPPLSKDFEKLQYVPSIYFYSQNSTFYNDPFFDTIIKLADRSHYHTFKRINIIYYNTQNTSDIMARTFPATSDFQIKNKQDVAKRFNDLQLEYVDRTNVYLDTFSRSNNTTELVSVRSYVVSSVNPKVKIIIQVQLLNRGLARLLNTVYYFPSTNALFLQPNSQTGDWYASSSTKEVDFDLTPIIQPGIRTITLQNGVQVLAGTVGFQTHVPLNSFQTFSYGNRTIQRFALVTNANQTRTAYNFMEKFIKDQNRSLFIIIFYWTLFIIFLCIAMALTVGEQIFSHLEYISTLIINYIQNPKLAKNIISNLQSVPVKGTLKLLIKMVTQIIKKIELRKVQIEQKKTLKLPRPLNMSDKQFQKKNGIKDYELLQNAEKIIIQRYSNHKQI